MSGLTLLIDAPSLTYRALFSSPDTITTSDGIPINAAHGFIWMLAQLVSDYDPERLACADDGNWRPEWRVDLLGDYKFARAAPGSAQEQAEARLEPQVPVLYALLELCGIAVIGHPEFEAEDVIGTLVARSKGRVAIVSGDRDLFQLVEDPDVYVIYPIRGVSKVEIVDESYIEKKFGIPGRRYLDYALLRGDPSDGLPGVSGIGEKSAASLVGSYGPIDEVMRRARAREGGSLIAKVRRNLDYLEKAIQVVTIRRDVPIEEVDISRPREVDEEVVMAGAERLGLAGPTSALIAALRS
jgi:5'-3' exonuclease